MRRITVLALTLVLLITSLGVPAQAAKSKPWLPDPCTAFRAESQYLYTENYDSVNFDVYYFEVTMTQKEIEDALDLYLIETYWMEDTAIYRMPKESDDAFIYYEFWMKGTEHAEFAIFENGSHGEDTDWLAILVVPDQMSFTPGLGCKGIKNGDFRCVGCDGDGICASCFGTGRYNYGGGKDTCANCGGTGTCDVCDGIGTY